jgi:cytochrome c oxidase assembly protein subunit 15
MFRKWAVATFVLTLLVIIAGAVVRTTQSGMGCPDWPKCFGSWIPPTDASQLPPDFEKYLSKQDIDHSFNALHTWIEYINRLSGVLLGVFAIIQMLLAFGIRKTNRRSFNLAAAFLVVVILTGLFGAIVVHLNLAHLSITVHLLFALVLTVIQAALLTECYHQWGKVIVSPSIKKLLYAFLLLMLVHSSLGTTVRMHIDDVSKSLDYTGRETWLSDQPLVFLIHRSFSWLLLIGAGWIWWNLRKLEGLKMPSLYLLMLIILSMVTGIVLSYFDFPAWAQPTHLLLASLGITQICYLIFKSRLQA